MKNVQKEYMNIKRKKSQSQTEDMKRYMQLVVAR